MRFKNGVPQYTFDEFGNRVDHWSDAIIPDEILTINEVAQKKSKPQPQSASSSSVHAMLGEILLARCVSSAKHSKDKNIQHDDDIQPKHNGQYTDPNGYTCDS